MKPRLKQKESGWKPTKNLRRKFLTRLKEDYKISHVSGKQLHYTLIAVARWLRTKEGLNWVIERVGLGRLVDKIGFYYFSKHIGLAVRNAPKDKKYRLVDTRGNILFDVDEDDIEIITGVIVKGRLIPEEYLEAVEKPKHRCDYCGVIQFCTISAVDPHGSRVKICNYCAYHAREQGLVEYADFTTCLECNVMGCGNNPTRTDNKIRTKLLR